MEPTLVRDVAGSAQNPHRVPRRQRSDVVIAPASVARQSVVEVTLEKLDPANPGSHSAVWEKVVRKVRAGMMPPAGATRPARGGPAQGPKADAMGGR